jgi:hypothetical protein
MQKEVHVDIMMVILITCLCLASFVLGMIAMAILLHPYRKEVQRAQLRDATRRQLRDQLRELDR